MNSVELERTIEFEYIILLQPKIPQKARREFEDPKIERKIWG